MHFTPSGLEMCFGSLSYYNQLQLLVSPCLPVPNSNHQCHPVSLRLEHFIPVTFTTAKGMSSSVSILSQWGAEGMTASTCLLFPELLCVKLSPFNDVLLS